MKRWFRPLAYSTIAVLAALAVFGGEAPADASIAEPLSQPRDVRPSAKTASNAATPSSFESVRERRLGLPEGLFGVERPAPQAVPLPETAVPVMPSIPDIKVLGWMQSESGPHVFVEWNNESYTLMPAESVGEAYRFDRVEGGSADFTYLPTGESRRYTVSDPALLE